MHKKMERSDKADSNKTLAGMPTVNLSDFALFLSVMREKEAYRCVLSIILEEPEIEIMEVKVEKVVLNKSGKRAIRLDAWAIDADKRQFAMEMQNESNADFIPKRARFYQSLMDSPILKAGSETRYKNLPTTAVIFITQEDIFGKALAKYTFLEKCEEVEDLYLEDGTRKIFLNMSSRNGTDELVSLLQYIKDSTLENPEIIVRDERIQILDRIVQEVKESEEWEELSMNILEIGREQGITKGKAQGKAEGKSEDIIELLAEIGKVPDNLKERILVENDLSILSKWLKLAAKAESLDAFIMHM